MKWFLQFLSIGSVVLYALLIIIDERIPDSFKVPSLANLSRSSGA